jgi:Domain of unknown function (DUF5615)
MLKPAIARELRHRGHDVIAATERPDLADLSDPRLFDAAQVEQRAVVTPDAGGFLGLDQLFREQGHAHYGLILTSERRFNRGSPRSTGQFVLALDTFLRTQLGPPATTSLVHWLQ